MPDNQGLSHLSDHFLIVAVVLYSLAVIAFAADFAFGRRSPVVSRAGAGGATGYPRRSGRVPRQRRRAQDGARRHAGHSGPASAGRCRTTPRAAEPWTAVPAAAG